MMGDGGRARKGCMRVLGSGVAGVKCWSSIYCPLIHPV